MKLNKGTHFRKKSRRSQFPNDDIATAKISLAPDMSDPCKQGHFAHCRYPWKYGAVNVSKMDSPLTSWWILSRDSFLPEFLVFATSAYSMTTEGVKASTVLKLYVQFLKYYRRLSVPESWNWRILSAVIVMPMKCFAWCRGKNSLQFKCTVPFVYKREICNILFLSGREKEESSCGSKISKRMWVWSEISDPLKMFIYTSRGLLHPLKATKQRLTMGGNVCKAGSCRTTQLRRAWRND